MKIKGLKLNYIELCHDAFVQRTLLKQPFYVCPSFCLKLKEMDENPYF